MSIPAIRSAWSLIIASVLGILLVSATASATPFVVPNGALQVEENSGTNILLSGNCGPESELNQPIRSAFYQGNGIRGGLIFEFIGKKVSGHGEIAVNIDFNTTVQSDPSFVLDGDFTASGVTANGAAVGSGSGSGSVNQGGFIFTDTGTQQAPEKGKVENLSMIINDFGGISGCILALNNFTIEFLIPVAAGTIGATTPTVVAVLPQLQYQDISRGIRGIRSVISAAFPGLISGSAATGITPLASGGMRYQGMSGLSAGDGATLPWGVWANLELSFFEDEFAATAYDADRNAIMLGGDISPRDNMIVGMALMYSMTDIESTFNSGGGDIDTLSIIPYMALRLSEELNLNFDLMGGYGELKINQFRSIAGTQVSSKTSGRRFFISGDLSATHFINDLTLTGIAGMLYAHDRIDDYTESNGSKISAARISFGQFHVDGEVAYSLGRFTPFASLSYERDFTREDLVTAGPAQPANDSDGFRAGLGLRFYADDNWTGSARFDKTFGRKNIDEYAFSLQVHGSF